MAATATGGSGASETEDSEAFTGFGDAATTGSSDGASGAQSLVIGFGRSYGLALVFIGVSAGFFML